MTGQETGRGPTGSALPITTSSRWQPLRAGLVDLFYYDYQEFWFRDGRVMFRGNNGTGKSKVLALTLPFLLDGDLTPSRVEPDGDRDKRMEWNLLLGGKYEERLGYAWLEFGRVTEDGERAYLTIGAGLKAAAGRGIADRWFFLTAQRPGEDLFLIGPSGTALTKDRLTGAIGLHGQVTQRAEQYRRMIDEHLFRLGAERYDALISLLIQLRQPQLSKRPDEGRLSRALSDALAPVDQAVLSDIAAAFHDLEQQRDELAALRDTRGHVARFLERYRRYAGVAARRQARAVRGAHSAYEQVQRGLAEVRQAIEQAAADETTAGTALDQCRLEYAEQMAVREELAADPRLKNFDDAQRYAEAAREAAGKARRAALYAAGKNADRRAKHDAAAAAASRTRAHVTGALTPPAEHAAVSGFADGHTALVDALALPDGHQVDGPDGPDRPDSAAGVLPEEALIAAERTAGQLATDRLAAVDHVVGLAESAARQERELVQARRVLGERERDRDAAGDALAAATEALGTAAEAHAGEWRAYRRTLTELAIPDPEEAGLAAWAESMDGPHPLGELLRARAASAQRELATAKAGAQAVFDDERAALRTLVEERARLDSGSVLRPPVPYTRGEDTRRGPGAALWQVADFAPELGPAERAGLEAALEAAGLLDAWITPDGMLVDPRTHDVIAIPGTPVATNLTAALRPAIDATDAQAAALTADTVARVLSSIGLGRQYGEHGEQYGEHGEAWVDTTGRWRLGPLHGAWSKDAAAYVGHGTREEARRRRLAELAEAIEGAERSVAVAREAVDRLDRRIARLADEQAREPSDQPLRDAHGVVGAAGGVLEREQRRVGDALNEVEWAHRDLQTAVTDRDEAAADLNLPGELSALAAVRESVRAYRQAVAELVAAARRHADRLATQATWEEELRVARAEAEEAEREAFDAETRAAEEQSRLDALRESMGASVDELKERLTSVRARIAQLDVEIKRLDADHRAAGKRLANAEGHEGALRGRLAEEQGRRDAAVRDFQRFAATGLLTVGCAVELPETDDPWAADPAVRLARRAEEQLKDVDDGDEAWRRIQDEITRRYTELSEALTRHGHHAVAGLDDWFVVAIQFQGKDRAPAELTGLLDDEIDYRGRMLTAKERDLLEEHLVNDVASHLQELISEAEAQVGHMNAELEERPTSTGMRLRLRWEARPDGPAGLAEARARLLRQNADLWSPADRTAVGEFLHRQIEAVRAADEYGTWQDHLRTALDYRTWHRFVIERYQDGRWRSAIGPASGGERVLTVSLPLFAAASAHYRSAHPHAPRLVMLDEAFAGVDDDSRAKCLGLLATFDLDVAMTSEREWGFYATVPGIAAHQLVRRDGIDAVHVTTWEWDGRTRERVDRVFAAQAPAGRSDAVEAAEEDALW